MAEPLTITRSNPAYPEYLDFGRLRTEGIRHIESLAGKVWTDYNLHDPGITILEVLCYALTDLGYRNQFDIRDLLAQKPGAALPEDNFFTANEILSCNPVTLMDYRKLLIDIEGVRNAWIIPADTAEFPIYVNPWQKRLQYYPLGEGKDTRLELRGIYHVEIELEPVLPADTQRDSCGNESVSVARILQEVRATLHRHRNLCTDFMEVNIIGDEPIAFCAEVEIAPNAVPEEVEVLMYQQIQAFFTPPIHFYTLEEMVAQGKSMEDIFAGRPFTVESHGFVDVDELARSELRQVLNTSDLYQVLMDVPGVRGVKNLTLTSYLNELRQSRSEAWRLQLLPGHRPVVDIVHSGITFFKDVLPFRSNKAIVRERFEQRLGEFTKTPLKPEQLDRAVPSGRYGELADYTSIQHEFPLAYGIGEAGLPDHVDAQRRAQARQLKGYLLFFDQLLANYLAQLAHVRDLFSMRRDQQRSPEARKTYFSQLLQDVPALPDLIAEYLETSDHPAADPCEAPQEAGTPPADRFSAFLASIAEDDATYFDRRNRFLDHMLSRFSETFTDYVLLMFAMSKERHDDQVLIDDKSDFLQNYARISRNRGKGADYKDPDAVWNTENVSGLEMRVSKLMGVTDHRRRNLCNFEVICQHELYRVQLRGWDGEVLLQGIAGFDTREAAEAEIGRMWEWARSEAGFYRLDCVEENTYGLGLKNADGQQCAFHPQTYDSVSERDAVLYQIIYYAQTSRPDYSVVRSGAPWQFRWLHESGETMWQSPQGFFSAHAAWDGLRDALSRAGDPANVRKLDNEQDGYYGLELKQGAGVGATHPQTYHSPRKREYALQRWQEKAQQAAWIPDIVQLPATFGFVLSDAAGAPLCESFYRFAEPGQTICAYNRFVLHARQESAYRRIDDPAHCTFSFEIRNEDEMLLAKSSQVYPSRRQREAAMAACMSLAAQPDRLHGIYPSRDASYRFELHAPGCHTSLPAKYNYAEEVQAVYAFEELLSHAQDRTFYQPVQRRVSRSVEEIAPGLWEETLETHKTWPVMGTIHWTEEKTVSETLQESVSRHIRPTGTGRVEEWVIRTSRRETDPGDAIPLDEAQSNYGFNLVNAEGMVVSHHGTWYETEAAREAAIDELIRYISSEGFWEAIHRFEGPYRFFLLDCDALPVWIGEQEYDQPEAAVAAANEGVLLARSEAHYEAVSSVGGCGQGYQLLDEARIPLARNLRIFDKKSEKRHLYRHRLKLMEQARQTEIFAQLLRDPADHFFIFPMQEVMRDGQGYPSPAAAEAAFERLLASLAQPEAYREVTLPEAPAFTYALDAHPDVHFARFEDAESRSVFRSHITAFAAQVHSLLPENGNQLRICLNRERYAFDLLPLSSRFRYRVKDELGQDMLLSAAHFPSRRTAREAFEKQFLPALRKLDNWVPIDDPEALHYTFVLRASGETLATACRGFSGPVDRDRLWEAFVHHAGLPGAEIGWEVEELPAGYGYRLLDRTAAALSVQAHATEGEALAGLHQYLQLAARPEKHAIWSYQDEPDRYFFTLSAQRHNLLTHSGRAYDRRQEAEAPAAMLEMLLSHGLRSPETGEAVVDVKAQPFYYQLINAKGAPVLRSTSGFLSESLAWEACETHLAVLNEQENYRFSRDFTVNCGYRIEVGAADKVLAASTKYAASTEAATRLRDQIIRQINQEGFHVLEHLLLRPSNRGSELTYAFQLTGPGNQPLLVSAKGYASYQEAHERYEEMRELAQSDPAVGSRYLRTEQEDHLGRKTWGFDLTDRVGQHLFARHPRQYSTPERREQAIADLVAFLEGLDERSPVVVEDATFSFVLLDPDARNEWFTGVRSYLDRTDALRAFGEFQKWAVLAHQTATYDWQQHGPLTIVRGLGGEALARSHDTFETEAEVRAVLEKLALHLVPETFDFQPFVNPDRFRYLITDEADGETLPCLEREVGENGKFAVLFRSADTHEDEATAIAAYRDRFVPAAQGGRYDCFHDPETGEYGFRLVAEDGAVVAYHGVYYATAAERDYVLDEVRGYLARYLDVIEPGQEKDPASWGFHVLGKSGNAALSDHFPYKSEEAARRGFLELVHLLADPGRYVDVFREEAESAGFTFSIADRPAVIAAGFDTEAARQARKEQLLRFGMRQALPHALLRRPAAFYFQIPGAAGEMIWESAGDYSTAEEAENAYHHALSLFREGGHVADESVQADGGMLYSFVLHTDGAVLARHVYQYPDAESRDAMREAAIIAGQTTSSNPLRDVRPRPDAWYFELRDTSGVSLLTGTGSFSQLSEALDAYRQLREWAADRARFEPTETPGAEGQILHGIAIGGGMAVHPITFPTSIARNQAIDRIHRFVSSQGVPHVIVRDQGFYARLHGADGGEVFRSVDVYPSPGEATVAREWLLHLARQRSNYRQIDPGPEVEQLFSFLLVDEELQKEAARHDRSYPSALLRDQAIDALIDFFNDRDRIFLRPIVEGDKPASTEEKEALARPCNDTVYESAAARDKMIEQLLAGAQEPGRIDGAVICHEGAFYFGIFGRDAVEICTATETYADPAAARAVATQWLEQIAREDDAATINPRLAQFIGTADPVCMALRWQRITARARAQDECHTYLHILVEQDAENRFFVRLTGTGLDLLLRGVHRYGSYAAARRDCDRVLFLMKQAGHYERTGEFPAESDISEPDGAEWSFRIVDANEDQLMPVSVSEGEIQSPYFPENIDPYSDMATVVLPYWPRRFRDVNFRNFFENTLRREVPAHVALRIVWVNLRQMSAFESHYRTWLEALSRPYRSCSQTRSLNGLLRNLSELNNIFPLATLYDSNDESGNPVILNHTLLGSANT